MAALIKVLTATGKASIGLVAAVLIAIGGLLMIGGCVYRVFVRPEWTFEESLHALWPFLVAGIVCLMLGWFVDRAEG